MLYTSSTDPFELYSAASVEPCWQTQKKETCQQNQIWNKTFLNLKTSKPRLSTYWRNLEGICSPPVVNIMAQARHE